MYKYFDVYQVILCKLTYARTFFNVFTMLNNITHSLASRGCRRMFKYVISNHFLVCDVIQL